MGLVYLACPFRHTDASVQRKRCAAAHYVAAQLSAHHHVFSPLTHNELLVDLVKDVPGEHWMEFDLAILVICKRLFVLQLEGWELSKGVQREIDFAKEQEIPVEMIAPPEEAKYLFLMRSSLPVEA